MLPSKTLGGFPKLPKKSATFWSRPHGRLHNLKLGAAPSLDLLIRLFGSGLADREISFFSRQNSYNGRENSTQECTEQERENDERSKLV
jgi:hypothetical protein